MSATATKPPLKLRAGDPIAILYRTRHVSGGIDLRKGIFLDCTWQHGYLKPKSEALREIDFWAGV